ncbi:non-hydrolyzing UDP-N-acetylglucosamine 2-epimerase [Microbacterium maritypicum]|uniref:non-hydrolyzing UDP-N-acetylglucosamine 2-epimerase n=1 Tax=Microbacterium maritypicum TaxID=33918 RepID=UPI003812B2F7
MLAVHLLIWFILRADNNLVILKCSPKTLSEVGYFMSRIAFVLGTRPEIIKLAPVIKHVGQDGSVIHTGQHYDPVLSEVQFFQLGISAPDVVLNGVGGNDRATQVARGIEILAKEFRLRRPKVVVVQGDTNAVTAAAQAANYEGIPVVHVEAGLRSYDRDMPEELNRLVAGVVADVHCAPTSHSVNNLLREGVSQNRIALTGNTVVEATMSAMDPNYSGLPDLPINVEENAFILSTIHRPENTDSHARLLRILTELRDLPLPVVFAMHPRTAAAVQRFSLEKELAGLHVVEGLGHVDFLQLAKASSMLVSDSGGLQEEATVIQKPIVVVRKSTERPESIAAGWALLCAPDMKINIAARLLLERHAQDYKSGRTRRHVYGDGLASKRISLILEAIADGLSAEDAITESERQVAPTDWLLNEGKSVKWK